MNPAGTDVLELEPHRLELRFAPTRVARCRRLEGLGRSLERDGQLTALVAVPAEAAPDAAAGGAARYVLIDGYRRLAALRRLGRDTARVEVWRCTPSEALCALLARTQALAFEPLEEALLLRELTAGGGLSQSEVARRCARDVSWVSRRLSLLGALPEPVLEALGEGWVSSWAASRVLAPLARANAAHAERLLGRLRAQPLSTRALKRWFEHYARADRATRERLVEHPALFVEAHGEVRASREAARLGAGPEGEWLAACERAARLCAWLRRRLGEMRCPAGTVPGELACAFEPLALAVERLRADLERYATDDPVPCARDGSRAPRQGGADPRGQPAAGAVAKHGSPHPAHSGGAGAAGAAGTGV